MTIHDFYIPKHRYELIELLSKMFPSDKNKFKRYNKKRLYAIYFSVMTRNPKSKNKPQKNQGGI